MPRRPSRVVKLEAVVERQAAHIAHLLSQLKRATPNRQKVSSTRSIWLAGRQNFRCAGDPASCPCWLLRDGTFSCEGWECDHIDPWSTSFDHRDSNLRCLCHTCHARVTREQWMMRAD